MGVDLLRGRPEPVVVVGMHRSGTSAVSALLQRSGVNMGLRQEANGESRFFLRMNHWMLTQMGVSWATPGSLPALPQADIDSLASMVQRRARSWAAVEHFGPHARNEPWGFKDPRITLLFEIYDQVFPNAKLVLVTRHGVDVAQSLRVRAMSPTRRLGSGRPAPLLGMRQPGASRLQSELLTADLERNFELWLSYQQRLTAIADSVDADRFIGIRFEDLATDPVGESAKLAAFVGVDDIAAQGSVSMDAARAFAHRSSAELTAFATAHAEELARFGY